VTTSTVNRKTHNHQAILTDVHSPLIKETRHIQRQVNTIKDSFLKAKCRYEFLIAQQIVDDPSKSTIPFTLCNILPPHLSPGSSLPKYTISRGSHSWQSGHTAHSLCPAGIIIQTPGFQSHLFCKGLWTANLAAFQAGIAISGVPCPRSEDCHLLFLNSKMKRKIFFILGSDRP
jgi:hypothetical protein